MISRKLSKVSKYCSGSVEKFFFPKESCLEVYVLLTRFILFF
jgi:hypothetical protein